MSFRLSSTHSIHLDALRGLAALVVVGFHARLLFFVDRADIAPDLRSALTELFYVMTAFGREAVLAFFVLSGFLIAGSIHRDSLNGRWSAIGYVIARLSRLYVVVLPALVLGIVWDSIGLHWFAAASAYTGHLPNAAFPYDVAARLAPVNILGTLGFVQSIVVSPPGSNEQFWSLAYEFWCYALFPLLYFALTRAMPIWQRCIGAAAMIALAWAVGVGVFTYFGCWLIGAAVAVAPASIRQWLGRYRPIVIAFGLVIVGAALYLIKANDLRMPTSGFVLALGFALVIAGSQTSDKTSSRDTAWMLYSRAAQWLSLRSFSLYATHVPPLVFLRAWQGDQLWQPTLNTIALWLVMVVGCLIYADLVWRLAERHTPAVRHWLMRVFVRPSPV